MEHANTMVFRLKARDATFNHSVVVVVFLGGSHLNSHAHNDRVLEIRSPYAANKTQNQCRRSIGITKYDLAMDSHINNHNYKVIHQANNLFILCQVSKYHTAFH